MKSPNFGQLLNVAEESARGAANGIQYVRDWVKRNPDRDYSGFVEDLCTYNDSLNVLSAAVTELIDVVESVETAKEGK